MYDATSADMFAADVLDPTVDFLAALASGGPVLEFAVGTGRVALPLAARGVEVHGLELSRAMVAQLRSKPGGAELPVTIGDMATAQAPTASGGRFALVYLVFNTISNLLTQDEQVACFANAAAHLRPGGHFVIEVFVPQLRRLPPGETLVPGDVSTSPDGTTHVCIDEYDLVGQGVVSHHVWVRGGRAETFDSPHRYALTGEYDLMARLAGLTLVERWADWHRQPFDSDSESHVSVWRK